MRTADTVREGTTQILLGEGSLPGHAHFLREDLGRESCGWFVEILLGAKFLHACRGGGSFSNPGDSNRVPPQHSTVPSVCLESKKKLVKYPKLFTE